MTVICYKWANCDVLWRNADWKWADCKIIDEIISTLPPHTGVPGEWAQPSWLQEDKPYSPYDKEKRKRFIRLIARLKDKTYDEKKEVREDIKISIDDIKLAVKAVRGIEIEILDKQ